MCRCATERGARLAPSVARESCAQYSGRIRLSCQGSPMCWARRATTTNPGRFRTPGDIDAELPILARTKTCRRDKNPRLVLRIHIHLGDNRHAIFRAVSSHDASKPQEGCLRKRLEEREGLFDQPTLFLPTLQRQSWTPIQPPLLRSSIKPLSPATSSPK